MRQMIDPSTIKVDTSNFWDMGTHVEGTGDHNNRRYFGWRADGDKFYFEPNGYIGYGLIGARTDFGTYGIMNRGFIYIPSHVNLNDDKPIGYNNYAQIFKFPIVTSQWDLTSNKYYDILTDKTVKTIFGQSIYSADGTGNIDLYAHDITITKGTGKAFLTVYSSNNTNIDSLDDLKTIAGVTFTKSCTGYINSKIIVAITETSFILSDGTTEALTGATFVDNPTTI